MIFRPSTRQLLPVAPAAPGKDGPTGVTLVELLVALSILSLMAVLLLGGMHLGLRVWESGGDRQVFEQRLERADGFLRQLLAQAGRATPVIATPGAEEISGPAVTPIEKAGFVGEADRMIFVALLPYQLGSAGNCEFQLSRHSNDRGGNLVLSWRRNIGAMETGGPAQTVLLAGVRSIRLAYFGHLTNESAAAWHDSWADPMGLPALIRLDLSLSLGQELVRLTLFYTVRFSNNGV
ncbi:MAG TPA: prepilin-type N-terminal cleavage/methylation domain-containing protein [Dongiaceae bacterium]|jgi:general secretion pathway protein J|nr:prepilin-type N-terminal cleavage/methylation domain-containing protein [Dongiaceae bacterium]